jgi:hypothetical protein
MNVDSHVFSHHPERSTLWQALRTPQYTGLTKTYDPISLESQIERIAQRIGDRIEASQRLSDLENHYYFQKQLMKVRNALVYPKKKIKASSYSSYSEREEEDPLKAALAAARQPPPGESSSPLFVISSGDDLEEEERPPKLTEHSRLRHTDPKTVSWRPFDFDDSRF